MAPRPRARMRRLAWLGLAAVGLLSLAGCDPRALMYFLQPFDPTVAPKGDVDLKGKKVVVLTHAVQGTQNDFRSLDRDVTRELIKILREKVKKIDIVDPDRVAEWLEAHPSWTDPAEAAKAFEADMVIFLEIEQFQIDSPSEPDLFKGVARIHVQVHELKYPKNSKGKEMTDKPKESEVVYDNYNDTDFPNKGHMPKSGGVSRGGFKNKFLKLVATELSWHFVEHAPGDDIQDTKIY